MLLQIPTKEVAQRTIQSPHSDGVGSCINSPLLTRRLPDSGIVLLSPFMPTSCWHDPPAKPSIPRSAMQRRSQSSFNQLTTEALCILGVCKSWDGRVSLQKPSSQIRSHREDFFCNPFAKSIEELPRKRISHAMTPYRFTCLMRKDGSG